MKILLLLISILSFGISREFTTQTEFIVYSENYPMGIHCKSIRILYKRSIIALEKQNCNKNFPSDLEKIFIMGNAVIEVPKFPVEKK